MIDPITYQQLVDAEKGFNGVHLSKYRITIPGLQEPGPLSLSGERNNPVNQFRQSLNKVTDGNISAIMSEISNISVDDPVSMAKILFEKVIEEPQRAHIFFTVVSRKEIILRKFILLCHQDQKEAITLDIPKINKLIDGDIEDTDTEKPDSFYNYCRRKVNMMKLLAIIYTLGFIKVNIIEQCRNNLLDILILAHDEEKKFINFMSEEDADKFTDDDYYSFLSSCDRLYGNMLCHLILEGMVELGEKSVGGTDISINNTLSNEEFAESTIKMIKKLEGKMEYEHTEYLLDKLIQKLENIQ